VHQQRQVDRHPLAVAAQVDARQLLELGETVADGLLVDEKLKRRQLGSMPFRVECDSLI